MLNKIINYIPAGYPGLYIVSPEEQRIEAELGDVLFVIANIARRWHVNPEEALRASNRKFEGRVQYIEQKLRSQNRSLREATLPELERLYQEGKRVEQHQSDPKQ